MTLAEKRGPLTALVVAPCTEVRGIPEVLQKNGFDVVSKRAITDVDSGLVAAIKSRVDVLIILITPSIRGAFSHGIPKIQGLTFVGLIREGDSEAERWVQVQGWDQCYPLPFKIEDAISVRRAIRSLRRAPMHGEQESQASREDFSFLGDDAAGRRAAQAIGAEIIGNSDLQLRVKRQLVTASLCRSSLILYGESGTCKSVAAKAVHKAGPWSSRPVMVIECARLEGPLMESELFGHEKGAFTHALMQKPSPFELADGGTVILEDIQDLSPGAQPKLLRFLQERVFMRVGGTASIPSNVRIIATTNRDLRSLIREGTFREDLYFRLKVLEITMPPLRKMKEDIHSLVRHFLWKMGFAHVKMTKEALERIRNWHFQNNGRELEGIVHRALVLGAWRGSLKVEHLYGWGEDTPNESEREDLVNALTATAGNVSAARRLLGCSRPTIYARCKKYGIDWTSFRREKSAG